MSARGPTLSPQASRTPTTRQSGHRRGVPDGGHADPTSSSRMAQLSRRSIPWSPCCRRRCTLPGPWRCRVLTLVSRFWILVTRFARASARFVLPSFFSFVSRAWTLGRRAASLASSFWTLASKVGSLAHTRRRGRAARRGRRTGRGGRAGHAGRTEAQGAGDCGAGDDLAEHVCPPWTSVHSARSPPSGGTSTLNARCEGIVSGV